jgi:acyl-CoA synthetase (AMP-forming)/AMP-acid ligase II
MILVSPEHIASYTQAGWWSEQTIGELFLQTAARQPEAPAVIDAPNRPQISGDAPLSWRWQDVLTQTGRLVALFAAQGLRKDDVVVMQLPNCAEMHAIYLACALTGVVVSPVPVQYRAHELDHILQITGAQAR